MSRWLPLILICSLNVACGYHTAGHVNVLPDKIRTIAVPAFVNQTQTYKIEQRLTAAVVQELLTRTNYHIVDKATDAADATLEGTVLSTYTTPLTYDSVTGRAASVLVMSVSIKPGAMALEVMRRLASSRAAVLVRPSNPALEAA